MPRRATTARWDRSGDTTIGHYSWNLFMRAHTPPGDSMTMPARPRAHRRWFVRRFNGRNIRARWFDRRWHGIRRLHRGVSGLRRFNRGLLWSWRLDRRRLPSWLFSTGRAGNGRTIRAHAPRGAFRYRWDSHDPPLCACPRRLWQMPRGATLIYSKKAFSSHGANRCADQALRSAASSNRAARGLTHSCCGAGTPPPENHAAG